MDTMGFGMHTGTVLWYDDSRGYGFVKDHRDNQKVFITHTALEDFGVTGLNSGARICFDITQGKVACKVSAIRSVTRAEMLH